MKNNMSTHYRLNPDYWKLKYFRTQNKLQNAHLTGLLAGFAMALLAYITATCAR